MTALLSVTVFKYFEDHRYDKFDGIKTGSNGFEIPTSINIGMPFSLRQPVEHLKDLKFNNDVVGLPLKMSVYEGFEEALSDFKKKF